MAFSFDPALQSNQLPISFDIPKDSEDMRNFLSLHLKRTRDSVNTKEGALYQLMEQATFQQYYSTTANNTLINRNTYRRVYDLVSLNAGVPIPPGATNIILAGNDLINGIFQHTRGYGAAIIAGPIYIFYPGTDGNIRFDNTVPAAQVIRITNNSGAAWTTATWIMEYTKN